MAGERRSGFTDTEKTENTGNFINEYNFINVYLK